LPKWGIERAGLLPPTEKHYKLHPLLETAIEELASKSESKQVLAAKLIRVIAEDA